jgi:CheY-like chemotaxis protein
MASPHSAMTQRIEGISAILCDDSDTIVIDRNYLPNVPRILLTENRSLPHQFEWKAQGFEAYLIKPVFPKEVLDTIVRLDGHAKDSNRQLTVPAPSSKTKLRVLVAEDNPVSRMLAVRILEKLGHDIVVADSGNNAVQLATQSDFDIILMDLQMPGLDGCAATQAIRKAEETTGKHVKIIAITAHAMTTDIKRCLEAGMDKYLSKPVDPAKLIELLSSGGRAPCP